MSDSRARVLLGTVFLSLAMSGAVYSGGFARGTADTDLLYEDGNFNMRSSATFVTPKREISKVPGTASPALVGTTYTEDYVIPSVAIKLNVTDNVRCAATLVDNNGGAVSYAVPKPSGKLTEDFATNEKAVTCGVKFQAGPGNFWLLGGGFVEEFDYHRLNATGVLPLSMIGGTDVMMPNADLTLSGRDTGYRLGIAYEIPDIALRAQLMYRSGTSYGATGSLTVPTAALLAGQAQAATDPLVAAGLLQNAADALAAGLRTAVDSTATGNLPQSVELKLQSGIAPGWLAFGSVKWTDWSVQKQLLVSNAVRNTSDDYFWKDGWTVTGGIGHAFNDRVSGRISLTWDSGVGSGYDFSSDTYTLALGGLVKDSLGGELRGGVGVSYLSAAEVTKGPDAGFAVKAGYALGGSVGYSVKW